MILDKQPSSNETLNLKLAISSSSYSPKTKILFVIPEGIELLGNSQWEGDLRPNETIQIETRIKVKEDLNLPIQAFVQTQNTVEPYQVSIPLNEVPVEEPQSSVPAPPINQTPQASQAAAVSGAIFYNITWECSNNRECAFNQQCVSYKCQNFTCEGYCKYIKDHQCLRYECCSDAECNPGYLCIENECRANIQDATNKIAFYHNGTIYIMNNDGTNITKLTDAGFPEGKHPAWSPDGKKIAFGHYNIYTINIDGTNKTLLTGGSHPSWTPDGKKIVYAPGGINIIDIDSGNTSTLYTQGASIRDPVVSPDGAKIAFVEQCLLTSLQACPPIVIIMNADGSNDIALGIGHEPSWSPDGKKIVFSVGKIKIIDIETKNETLLISGFSPSWSPKGDKIVYDDGNGISIINVDRSNQTKLTDFGNFPAWSPLQT